MQPQLFDDLAPPMQGQCFLLAHSTTGARYQIPPQWRGAMVTFTSSGSDLYLAFGNANVKIESAEVSVAVSEVLAANWASGVVIPAGSSLHPRSLRAKSPLCDALCRGF